MKKHLLFATGMLASGLLSAQVGQRLSKIPANLSNIAVKQSKLVQDKQLQFPGVITPKKQTFAKNSTHRVAAVSEAVIGFTNYDLQSNGSVGDRIVVNADGTIAAVWTYDPGDGGTYANRGTGYNYYNGSAWTQSPNTTSRIETSRVGWGNIVNTASGKELVLSHNGTAGIEKLHLATRPVKGTGAWAESNTTIPNVPGGNWWPRMVSSGENVYAISISYPVANGGTVYQGLDGALLFSRSTDGGATWDIVNQIPTGLNLPGFSGFSGDGYAIAAKGSTVAIIAGDAGTDLVLSKSTDGGATWTARTVMQFPLANWDPTTQTSDINSDGIPDTLETNDGNLAIAIDNFGKAFVSYGRMRIFNDVPDANGYSYFPYIDGLYIWNESMPTHMAGLTPGTNVAAIIEDVDGDGEITFPVTPAGTFPFGLTRANSLTSFPSLAFDASNTLYLSYSAIIENLLSVDPSNTKVVRHVVVKKSCDEGVNFTAPLDIVPFDVNGQQEGIYGSMAKNVDGNVHIVYQRDYYVGNGIPGTSAANPDGGQLDNGNDIVYAKIPVGDLGNCPIPTGIKQVATSVANLSFYPNPASTNGTIEVVLVENAKMDVSILNAVGQTVYSTSVSGNVGNNKVEVNLNNLSAGLYFYQVKVGNGKAITKKFAVEK